MLTCMPFKYINTCIFQITVLDRKKLSSFVLKKKVKNSFPPPANSLMSWRFGKTKQYMYFISHSLSQLRKVNILILLNSQCYSFLITE